MQNYQLPEGKVLVLRSCKPDMTSKNDFAWPESGPVSCPDWRDNAECGNGLHGWLWAQGDYDLKYKDVGAKWLVVEVDAQDVRQLNGKVKFPKGNVLLTGNFRTAYDAVMKQFWLKHAAELRAMVTVDSNATYSKEDGVSVSTTETKQHASAAGEYGHASAAGYSGHASAAGESGHASAAGYSGHASAAGYSGHASAAGNFGHASAAGEYGHASAAGYSGHASAAGKYGHASAAGEYGHASAAGYSGHASAAGYSGHASAAGKYGHAVVLGLEGTARCGENGALILTYWDGSRRRHVIGYAGENGIEAGKWYKLNDKNELEETKVS